MRSRRLRRIKSGLGHQLFAVGRHFYLYMIIDIYSRKIIAAEVFASESGKHAAELLQRAVWNEKCSSSNLVLHSDNGSPMRSYTLRTKCMRSVC